MPRLPTLTRAAIRALRPGQRLSGGGITCECLDGGDRRYSVAARVDGQRIHRVIGLESQGVTLTQAQAYLARVRTEAREGRLKLPHGRKLTLTIAQAAQQYLQRMEGVGGKDLRKKRQRFAQHLLPALGKIPLEHLSTFGLEKYKAQRLKAGAKPATINLELATLSHLLTLAVEWRWLPGRPVQIRRLPVDNVRTTYLTVAQIHRLTEAALHHSNPQLYPFVRIALGTSMRQGEILRMRVEDVDCERRLIHIPHAKSGARQQPMLPDLVEYLRGYIASLDAGIPWLFPSRQSHSGHTVTLFGSWRSMLADAGLHPDRGCTAYAAAYGHYAPGASGGAPAHGAADFRTSGYPDGRQVCAPGRGTYPGGDGDAEEAVSGRGQMSDDKGVNSCERPTTNTLTPRNHCGASWSVRGPFSPVVYHTYGEALTGLAQRRQTRRGADAMLHLEKCEACQGWHVVRARQQRVGKDGRISA